MARYSYVILSRAAPRQEEAFDRWYDDVHLGDVKKVPGVVDAQRHTVLWQEADGFEAPAWRSLALYQIEADDPHAVVAAIRARANTPEMPLSESLIRDGMVQMIARPSRQD